jgi:hypothetical protein
MLPHEEACVFGFPPTEAQFSPFVFPEGCVLEVSSYVRGALVRARFRERPSGAFESSTIDVAASQYAVCCNYLKAAGVAYDMHKLRALLTWARIIEWVACARITHVASEGAFRFRAIPAYKIVVHRSLGGALAVSLTGTVEKVEVRASTVRAVVDACSAILGEDNILGTHQLLNRGKEPPGLETELLGAAGRRTLRLVPLPVCCQCGSCVARGDGSCAPAETTHLPRVRLCGACSAEAAEAQCARRTVSVWGHTLRVETTDGRPTGLLTPDGLTHEREPRCDVPREYASPWSLIATGADVGGTVARRVVCARLRRTRDEVVLMHAFRYVLALAALRQFPGNVASLVLKHLCASVPMPPTTRRELAHWRVVLANTCNAPAPPTKMGSFLSSYDEERDVQQRPLGQRAQRDGPLARNELPADVKNHERDA